MIQEEHALKHWINLKRKARLAPPEQIARIKAKSMGGGLNRY